MLHTCIVSYTICLHSISIQHVYLTPQTSCDKISSLKLLELEICSCYLHDNVCFESVKCVLSAVISCTETPVVCNLALAIFFLFRNVSDSEMLLHTEICYIRSLMGKCWLTKHDSQPICCM
jgi:hypothetical protein